MDWPTHARRILERLGEDAAYTPSGGGGQSTVRGIYQQPYHGAIGMESTAPSFTCMSADVPLLKRGDTFTLRALVLKVTAIHADALSGMVTAVLQK